MKPNMKPRRLSQGCHRARLIQPCTTEGLGMDVYRYFKTSVRGRNEKVFELLPLLPHQLRCVFASYHGTLITIPAASFRPRTKKLPQCRGAGVLACRPRPHECKEHGRQAVEYTHPLVFLAQPQFAYASSQEPGRPQRAAGYSCAGWKCERGLQVTIAEEAAELLPLGGGTQT